MYFTSPCNIYPIICLRHFSTYSELTLLLHSLKQLRTTKNYNWSHWQNFYPDHSVSPKKKTLIRWHLIRNIITLSFKRNRNFTQSNNNSTNPRNQPNEINALLLCIPTRSLNKNNRNFNSRVSLVLLSLGGCIYLWIGCRSLNKLLYSHIHDTTKPDQTPVTYMILSCSTPSWACVLFPLPIHPPELLTKHIYLWLEYHDAAHNSTVPTEVLELIYNCVVHFSSIVRTISWIFHSFNIIFNS